MSAKKAKPAKKKVASKKAKPAAKKKAAPVKKAPKKAAPKRPALSWLDEETNEPLISKKAQQMESFVAAMADGTIDESEVQAQEKRLIRVMKEVEPMLDAATHAKVTQLLCELTAYDLMQVLHSFHQARPVSQFQG